MTATTSYDPWILTYTPVGNSSHQTLCECECPPPDPLPDGGFTGTSPTTCGAFLGNGKIGLLTSFDRLDTQKTMITTEMKYNNGTYKPNVIEPFHVNRVKFFDCDQSNVTTVVTQQELNLKAAIFTSTFQVSDKQTNCILNVKVDTYTPRNLPFCVMQTYTVVPTPGLDSPQTSIDLMVFHEVLAKNNLKNVVYNNNIIYNERINATKGMYMLSGTGSTLDGKTVVAASTYMFEVNDTTWDNLGYNVYRNDPNTCYNKFRLNTINMNATVKFHVLSAIMTEYDFEDPLEEVKRIVMNASMRLATAAANALRIRSDHVKAWDALWYTNIVVKPKDDITTPQQQSIEAINLYIRTCLYNLYSCMRENVNLEVNPLNLSLIDQEGFVLYDGDLWLIPLLLLLKPSFAKSMLEFRYKTIAQAQQISAGYGFEGGKYPYLDDVLGYKNALYYDVGSPLHMFNNALISINVWNYFRLTKDREWLLSKGYPILKAIADFFISAVDFDESTGTYHLNNTMGLTGTVSEGDNSFTNNAVRLSLRYAIEACYELTLGVRQEWIACYHGLQINYYSGNNCDVVKMNTTATEGDTMTILEPLFVLIPYMSQLYFCTDLRHDHESIKRNIDFYINKAISDDPDYTKHPYNVGALGILYGIYSQFDQSYVKSFETYMWQYIANNVYGAWNNMKPFGNRCTTCNSIINNAVFLMMILQGIPQLNVGGGVAETRFYYEEMRLKSLHNANMPSYWHSIKLSCVGPERDTFLVRNSYNRAYDPCGC